MSEAAGSGGFGRVVNRAGLASVCGVSLPTVDAWVERGCPFLERGSKGREWQFDTADVIEWRVASSVEAALAGYQGSSDGITKDEADRRKAVANAIVAEVGADEALGVTMRREEAEADLAAFCQVLKTGLSNAGSRIAGRASSITSATEIQELCEVELNRAFVAAQSELAARWSDDRGADREPAGETQPPPEG